MKSPETRIGTLSESFKRILNYKLYIVISLLLLMSGLILTGPLSGVGLTSPPREGSSGKAATGKFVFSDEISVRAAGRGNPWINLSDGRDIISLGGDAQFSGARAEDGAHPLTLCSADFDQDGVADLVSGHAIAGAGMVTFHRGNVDSIYPNSPEADQRKAAGEFNAVPFISSANTFELSQPPDFMGAGDFDADGLQDLVIASRGSRTLSFLRGDGLGSFSSMKRVELPGDVTALVTGDINRRDGLNDVAVGVGSRGEARVIIFEGPEGAANAKPEMFSVRSAVTSMALGQLDGDYPIDLAVAAGSDLVFVYGRDRKLSLDEQRRSEVREAMTGKYSLPSLVSSVAIGDFGGDHRDDIIALTDDGSLSLLERVDAEGKRKRNGAKTRWHAEVLEQGDYSTSTQLVRARVSSMPVDNLLILDSASERLRVLARGRQTGAADSTDALEAVSATFDVSGSPAAVLPMQLNTDALTDLVMLRSNGSGVTVMATQPQAVASVTSANSSGPGSLSQAILDANSTPGADTINFNIPGGGTPVIRLINQLPEITEAITIDGTTQPGGRVVVDGTGAGFGAEGLIVKGGNSRVRGMVMNNFIVSQNGFGGDGVILLTNGGNIVEGNIFGLDANGTTARGNSFGVYVLNSRNNLIGGTTSQARNIISGNSSVGVILFERDVFLSSGHTTDNRVEGNFIGTDITGATALGNGGLNIRIGLDLTGSNFSNNTIGGATAGARNVIAGSGKQFGASAVLLLGSAVSGTLIQGNLIGTDTSGNRALPNNGNGVQVVLSEGNTIGGTGAGTGNVVAASTFPGIAFGSFPQGIENVTPTSSNLVQGNFIGTNAEGTAALGNAGAGIILGGFMGSSPALAFENIVGGAVAGARNVISGNNGNGLMFINNGSRKNVALGNFIGTNAAGNAPLANQESGIVVTQALEITIGGAAAEARNVISGNKVHGIAVGIPSFGLIGGTGVRIENNSIGTNLDGTLDLGNQLDGIFLDAKSVDNVIENNTIAFNRRNGVFIPSNSDPGRQIRVISNLIFSNIGLGIDLGPTGVTENDPLDRDTGANDLQNFPVLGQVGVSNVSLPNLSGAITPSAVVINVPVTLETTPNTTCTIDFIYGKTCTTGGSQGLATLARKLGTRQMRTDASGRASETFTFTLDDSITSGFIKATATNPSGSTSEFSPQCTAVTIAEAGCSILCPPNRTVSATSASGAVVTYPLPTLSGSCLNVTITTTPPSGSNFPVGTTTVTATARDGSGVKGSCSFTVTVTPISGPTINRLERQGKKLVVFGNGFNPGAVILVNGVAQKTSNDLLNPGTTLVGKKAGKKIRVGNTVQVRNPDGTLSPPVTYTGT